MLVTSTRSRFATVLTDDGDTEGSLGDGATYHYRVHPFDSRGRVSRNNAYLSATTDPVPETPLGAQVYSNLPRRVVLTWEPSEAPNVAEYTVYRGPTAAGPWERRSLVEGRVNTVYEDPVDGDLRVMYYRISARNAFSGESEPTEPMRAVTKAEPLPPMQLEVTDRNLGRIDLRWVENVEPDIESYEIWHAERADGGRWSKEKRIGVVPPHPTEFSDLEVGCGVEVRYRLRAVDRDRLVSDYSEPLIATGLDLDLKLKPREGGAWELSWDPTRARGWSAMRVERVRFPLWNSVLGTVSGESHLRLPAPAVRPGERLAVAPVERAPADDGSAGPTVPDPPSCEISIPR